MATEEKLEFLGILKESLSIPYKHINFIIFILFASLPFFFLSVFFEFILQKTVLDTLKFISSPSSNYSYFYWHSSSTVYVDGAVSKGNLLTEWIKLCFLYLGPCYLLGLINITMTVNAAYMIYTAEKPISFSDLTRQNSRLKGPFITSVYVLLLSTCILLGLVRVVSNWYMLSKGIVRDCYYYSYYDHKIDYFVVSLITIFHVAVFIALLIKYSEWSAGWNMALVTSILEEL